MSLQRAKVKGRELCMFMRPIVIMRPHIDPWHFPRDALAANILDTLDSGIVNAITLFAPRRMGKTQFVLTDLAPRAALNGWLVSYCNLWDDKANPGGVIVSALAAATEPLKSASKRTGKLAMTANFGIVSATAEATEEVAARSAPSRIGEAFRAFAGAAERHARDRRLMLVIDEIQHLAAGKLFEPIAASLRTSLERHATTIKAVFTGSSQYGLQRLFLGTRAPFFSPGGQIGLPPLGSDFVAAMVERANKTFRGRVTVEEAAGVFEASGRSPYFLRQAITTARLRDVPLAQALGMAIEETLNEEGLARRWARLSATERGVALLVLEGRAPFAATSMDELAQSNGKGVRSNTVQTALLRLTREGFVERGMRGGYAVGDPMVRIWLERVRRSA